MHALEACHRSKVLFQEINVIISFWYWFHLVFLPAWEKMYPGLRLAFFFSLKELGDLSPTQLMDIALASKFSTCV